MAYRIEGDYFEACTCEASCPCIMLSPATEDTCDVVLAWHIRQGEKDGVDLSGLNAVMAVRSPKMMTEGAWRVALYVDDRAVDAQRAGLCEIFTGKSGGHIANVAAMFGETRVVEAPIQFTASDGRRTLKVGEEIDAQVEELTGMSGSGAPVIENALLGAVTQPLRQARSKQLRYEGEFTFSTAGRNSFIADFVYES
jgi:hypothetical protein